MQKLRFPSLGAWDLGAQVARFRCSGLGGIRV